jgi:hypothetical protein
MAHVMNTADMRLLNQHALQVIARNHHLHYPNHTDDLFQDIGGFVDGFVGGLFNTCSGERCKIKPKRHNTAPQIQSSSYYEQVHTPDNISGHVDFIFVLKDSYQKEYIVFNVRESKEIPPKICFPFRNKRGELNLNVIKEKVRLASIKVGDMKYFENGNGENKLLVVECVVEVISQFAVNVLKNDFEINYDLTFRTKSFLIGAYENNDQGLKFDEKAKVLLKLAFFPASERRRPQSLPMPRSHPHITRIQDSRHTPLARPISTGLYAGRYVP